MTTVAAMMPVRVVPMLAPRVSGKHVLEVDETDRRERGEGSRVMEEDCTMMVMKRADDDVHVAVEADDSAQDTRGGALDDDLQKVHDEKQAGAQRDEGNDGEESTGAVVGHLPVFEHETTLEEALVAEASLDLGAAHLVHRVASESPRRR